MTPGTLRALERVVCTKKAPHARNRAMRIAERARAKGEQISAYRCPFAIDPNCHWHVGHAPSMRTLQRVAEMLRERGQAPRSLESTPQAG